MPTFYRSGRPEGALPAKPSLGGEVEIKEVLVGILLGDAHILSPEGKEGHLLVILD
jgi:hypothetical protein